MKASLWKRICLAGAALALAATGSSALAQTVGGPYEYGTCAVPEAVTIAREDVNLPFWPPSWQTIRYVKWAGSAFTKMMPAAGTFTAKNPEGVLAHGPGQITNCVPGTGSTQWVALRIRTTGYFGTPVGNHIVVGARTSFPTLNSPTVAPYPNYDFMGVALSTFDNIFAERGHKPGADEGKTSTFPIPLVDGHTYLVIIHAGPNNMAYIVNDETTGASTDWQGFAPANVPLNATGLGLVVLCGGQPNCETGTNWKVEFFDVASGWM